MDPMDLLKSANEAFVNADADTGAGFQGEWPPEGDHKAVVTSIEVKASNFRHPSLPKNGTPIPCTEIQFHFKRIADTEAPDYRADDPANEMEWKGKEFQIVGNPTTLPDSPKGKPEAIRVSAESDIRRLKGHLSKLLGKPPEACVDIASDLSELMSRVKASTLVALVRCDYYHVTDKQTGLRTGKSYKTDFIAELIAG